MIKTWKPQGRKGVRYFLAFAWFFGLVFFGIGAVTAFHSIRLLAGSERHFGVVVRYDVSDGEKGSCFHPVVKVLEKEGLPQSGQELWSAVCSQSPEEEMGDVVPVLIPRDGREAEVATWGDLWLLPMVFGGIGLVWLLIGAIPVLLVWKRKQRLERLKSCATCYTLADLLLERNERINVNGQQPFQIVHEMMLDGKIRIFRSHNLWIHGGCDIKGPVHLYVNPRDPLDYAFDVAYEG